jgi:hypothetical protein
MFKTPIIKILQQYRLVVITVTIVMSISAVAMVTIPQTPVYATEDGDEDGDCDFDKEHCDEGECESYEFEGREVKHCDY